VKRAPVSGALARTMAKTQEATQVSNETIPIATTTQRHSVAVRRLSRSLPWRFDCTCGHGEGGYATRSEAADAGRLHLAGVRS
jgi:hypothetical protein